MKMSLYNFGAGPAMLPRPVLLEVQEELINWQNQGMSVMEVGHRTPAFQSLMDELEADLRTLISIPNHYRVLFLGGAARTQFAMIPLNFLHRHEQGGYLITGLWSSMAFDEANKLKKAYRLATSEATEYTTVPASQNLSLLEDTAYVYYTPNETVNGVRFNETPVLGDIPLMADMTSCLLSEPVNVSDFGLIFAGAQKNIAIAGLTIVMIRSDLLERSPESPLATMLDYRVHAQNQSLYSTPPTFCCYVAHKMLKWIKSQGGVEALYQINCQKAAALYQYIDASSFYHCGVESKARSIVNVCFSLRRPELESSFLHRANQCGLQALKGHRSVGGLRASLYNAMPMAGVETLIAFMRDFAEEHGE